MINYRCPKCHDQMSVPFSLAGQREVCPSCGCVSVVPTVAPPPAGSAVGPAQSGQVLWQGRPSWKGYLGRYVGYGLLAVLGPLLLGLLPALVGARDRAGVGFRLVQVYAGLVPVLLVALTEAARRVTVYQVTDRIVYVKRGILTRRTQELPVVNIHEIRVTQGLVQRLLKVGKVAFSSASTSRMEMIWDGVDSPEEVRDIVRAHITR